MTEKILVVEDDQAVARGLVYGLEKEGFKVIQARTCQDALTLAYSTDPHLILLDVRLPDGSGFDVCRQLRAADKRQPILMLTARDEEIDKVLGLELGADDYIVKPYSLRELISRIRAFLRRAYGTLATTTNPTTITFGDVELDLEKIHVTKGGQPVDLTPTEFRLLRQLVNHPDRPFSRDQLIELIWGYNSEIENDRTIDVHIRHLRQKLEADPANPHWFITIRGIGYKFSP